MSDMKQKKPPMLVMNSPEAQKEWDDAWDSVSSGIVEVYDGCPIDTPLKRKVAKALKARNDKWDDFMKGVACGTAAYYDRCPSIDYVLMTFRERGYRHEATIVANMTPAEFKQALQYGRSVNAALIAAMRITK